MGWTETLLAGMKLRTPGAAPEALAAAGERLGRPLPAELQELLRQFDGGAGTLGTRAFELWGVEKLVEQNLAEEIVQSAPGLLLIGSDGDAEALGFLPRLLHKPWGRISLMAAGAPDFEPLAASLADLLDAVARGR